ncbi:SusC/RagA family TonB-linked outer membrane protein [Algoriphagus chordae]|uniref:TonB-linked SusC/RagA family outer membrane protein n=1 Tax=Algoriphagus chordae TaxID=237019 RepID=A0A2W7R7G9_9BACT|nr:TonB-dependent receptor [Algoriphagus chordae]PZX56793.1 TonB-linked SusC/RagA family outer membrane protein [Algoriphagus chordae]
MIHKILQRIVLLFFSMLLCHTILFAQENLISGTVISEEDDLGLPGVTVLVKGSTTGTATDIDGKYQIKASAGDVLIFSFIGYNPQEITVGNQAQIDVTLEVDMTQLSEVVVMGYGEQNRRDLTGSVVSVKSEELEQSTPVGVLDGMKGRMAGVSITSNGGPGEPSDIKIRGTSTLNGGTGPLYVVDGQQLDNIENLNPNDIASIEVLKDGASAAIYGSKSANGVILVTTKKGASGETKIDASYVRSYSSLATKIPVSNTRQARIYELARVGNNAINPGPPADSLSTMFNQDFDYQEMITRVGVRDQVGLALSGGKDDANFYWNTGFLNQDGIVDNSGFQRVNTTLNVNFNVLKRLKIGTRVNASYLERNGLNEGSIFGQLATHFPYLPTQDADGTYVPQTSSQQNVVAETIFTVRRSRDYVGQIFSYGEIDILPSLKFKSTLGVNLELGRNNDFDPTVVQPLGSPPAGSEITNLNYSIQQENYLSYKKSFGDHNLTGVVGVQFQRWQYEYSRFRSVNFNNDIVRTFNNVAELDAANTRTTATSHSLVSQFGRVTYDYKGKYLFGGTIRRDGSSRFGSAKQYGVFPGLSIGWRISDEAFWKPISSVFSEFKLRAGISQNGNERIGNFDSRTLYSPGFLYNGLNGIAITQLGNENLSWETTQQSYVGADFGFLNGRINASFDYYEKLTSDLLYPTPLPEETGFNSISNNIGQIKNSGIEFTISGDVMKTPSFQWFSSFNIATNVNEVVELAEENGQIIRGDFIIREGGSIGDMWGYTAEGVFPYNESNAFDDNGNQLTPIFDEQGGFLNYEQNGQTYTGNVNQLKVQNRVPIGGDVMWKDWNGDFNIDPNNDRTVIGNGLPKLFGGFYNEFMFKGIKLSMMIDYNFGNDIYRSYDESRNQRLVRTVVPGPDRVEEAWYELGDIAKYPSLNASGSSRNSLGPNTFWVSQADFIKLRSLRLDYSLPASVLDKVSFLSNVSFYASGNNLLTWTNYEGYNAELGSRGNALQPGLDNLRYPLYREYILGINIKL